MPTRTTRVLAALALSGALALGGVACSDDDDDLDDDIEDIEENIEDTVEDIEDDVTDDSGEE